MIVLLDDMQHDLQRLAVETVRVLADNAVVVVTVWSDSLPSDPETIRASQLDPQLVGQLRQIKIDIPSTIDDRAYAHALELFGRLDIAGDDLRDLPATLASRSSLVARVDDALSGVDLGRRAIVEALVDASVYGSVASTELLESLFNWRWRALHPNRYSIPSGIIDAVFDWALEPIAGTKYAVAAETQLGWQIGDVIRDHAHREVGEPAPVEQAELLAPGMQLHAGTVFLRDGQSTRATEWLAVAATSGVPQAMTALGALSRSDGRADDAILWFKKASSLGDAAAMSSLAGIERDRGNIDDAIALWTQAAERGDVPSMRVLGCLNFDLGDSASGRRWLEAAAAEGDTTSKYRLGVNERDNGNIEEAERWLSSAVEDGDPGAMLTLGRMHRMRGEINETVRLWTEAQRRGYSSAANNLGNLERNRGNFDAAKASWTEAVAQSNGIAAGNFARFLNDTCEHEEAIKMSELASRLGNAGNGSRAKWKRECDKDCNPLPGNLADLRRRFEADALTGSADAMHRLGGLEMSTGNPELARKWLSRAAEAGGASAAAAFGMFLRDCGDVEGARKWYIIGANGGAPNAMGSMGALELVSGNPEAARRWYRRAVDAGSISQAFALGH